MIVVYWQCILKNLMFKKFKILHDHNWRFVCYVHEEMIQRFFEYRTMMNEIFASRWLIKHLFKSFEFKIFTNKTLFFRHFESLFLERHIFIQNAMTSWLFCLFISSLFFRRKNIRHFDSRFRRCEQNYFTIVDVVHINLNIFIAIKKKFN